MTKELDPVAVEMANQVGTFFDNISSAVVKFIDPQDRFGKLLLGQSNSHTKELDPAAVEMANQVSKVFDNISFTVVNFFDPQDRFGKLLLGQSNLHTKTE